MTRLRLVFVGAAAILAATLLAGCDDNGGDASTDGMTHSSGMSHTPGMTHSPGMTHGAAVGTEGGQSAFAAIQEIVAILEADPATDWSRVNLSALREHLVDMDELTLRARVDEVPVEGGLRATATGVGRTVAAIHAMVPEHAAFLAQDHPTWTINVTRLDVGVVLTITSTDPAEASHLRGLGFFGFMATGSHHQIHHLMIARGETIHAAT